MNVEHQSTTVPVVRTLLLACVVCVAAACSSVPEPVAQMASARATIKNLEGTSARSLSPVLVDRAHTKLARAEKDITEKRYAEARNLAEQAQADAELANAQASAIQTQQAASDLDASIKVLRGEIDRARSTN